MEEGLDYILGHFEGQRLFPRTISTKTTDHRQVVVNNRQEALARFAQANFLDCRISAYPPPSEVSSFVGVNLEIAPSVVMIDLDRKTFSTQKVFETALSKILKKIAQQLNFQPTVIWSGNGYHIYLVLEAFVLEAEDAFNNRRFGEQPLQKFLRFEEWYLSNGRCCPQHNKTVSSRNCMLRIPGSVNSKNGQVVRIVQRWNGYRPNIKLLLENFYVHLCDERMKELQNRKNRHLSVPCNNVDNTIQWIETLLNTPITDYRKLTIWHILAPYLLNIRGLSYDESYSIIHRWLDKCNELELLTFNTDQKIKEGLRTASKGYPPISFGKLKIENSGLYSLTKASLDCRPDQVKKRDRGFAA